MSEGRLHIDLDTAVAEAIQAHPRMPEIFAAFHLGGCARCALSQFETIGQVCSTYGLDADKLLGAMNALLEAESSTEG